MTAVEWLISNLQQSKDWQRVLNEVSQMSTVQFNLLEQAKKMENEQIELAFSIGMNSSVNYFDGVTDEDENYYNETYGK